MSSKRRAKPAKRRSRVRKYKTRAEGETLVKAYASVAGSSGAKVDEKMDNYLLDVGERMLSTFRDRHIVAGVMNDTGLKAMHSTIATHSVPLSVNFMSNTLLKAASPDSSVLLEVINHPLRDELDDARYSEIDPMMPSLIFSIVVPIGLAMLAASYVILPIEERRCAAKQLQLMTGLSNWVYWAASFLCDFFLLILLIALMTACLPIFEKKAVLTSNGGAGVVFLIMLVYGFEAISFSYLISLYTNTVPGGFSLVTIIHILTGSTINMGVFATRDERNLQTVNTVLNWIGRLFPSFGISTSLMTYARVSFENIQCDLFPEKYREQICAQNFYSSFQKCCENCQELVGECFKQQSHLVWDETQLVEDWSLGSIIFVTKTTPGILQELVFMLIMAAIYTAALLCVENGLFKRILSWTSKTEHHTFTTNVSDEDVKAERERVANLVATRQTSNDALVVNNFSKSFGTFSAASNVSFGVHHGECFGLLGVNGAGKTTTFRMLTGDETRSDGDAHALNYSLDGDRDNFLGSMGYCPQFDGIIDVLTGTDMLELFATLRGIPRNHVRKEATKWISKMGLNNSGNVQCQKYSGGMKRRLCSAIAMIGDPKIVLLDECTTGVDPVARRDFWKIILASRNAGQAIVLTSHSMEECEALCSRLAIMVNGEFQCLGPVQHLKNKFAQGYSLTLKLSTIDLSDTRVLQLQERIISSFPPCTLKDQHQNILKFQLLNTQLEWGFLFRTLEEIRVDYGAILEDYSLNETTLEEVFLAFARQQYPERKAAVSWFKKLISLQCTSR